MQIPADTQKKIEEAMARLDASVSELRNIDYEKPLDLNDLLCLLHEIRKDAQTAQTVCWQAKVAQDNAGRCPRCGNDVTVVHTSGMAPRVDCGHCQYSGEPRHA